jgi:hypothetical protein
VDVAAFERDGFVAVRGAVRRSVVEECREAISDTLAGREIRRTEPASWPVLEEIDSLDGGPFATAGAAPAVATACDTLIGAGRWSLPIRVGVAIVVRFPSEDRANAGYHIEGSYDGPGGYWVNVASRGRGLLALFLLNDVGPDDAPTRLVCDSHRYIPQMLAPYAEAGTPADAELMATLGALPARRPRHRRRR